MMENLLIERNRPVGDCSRIINRPNLIVSAIGSIIIGDFLGERN